jgi:hypothetical protein
MSRTRKPALTPEMATAISDAAAAVVTANLHLGDVVATAHHAGASWESIGKVLGVSRQGAWERFHRRAEQEAARLEALAATEEPADA